MLGDILNWLETGPVIQASPLFIAIAVFCWARVSLQASEHARLTKEHAKDLKYALDRIEQLQKRMNNTPW